MAVGWTAMLLSLSIGTAIGVAAGYFKRADGFTDAHDGFISLPANPALTAGGGNLVPATTTSQLWARGWYVHFNRCDSRPNKLDANS